MSDLLSNLSHVVVAGAFYVAGMNRHIFDIHGLSLFLCPRHSFSLLLSPLDGDDIGDDNAPS